LAQAERSRSKPRQQDLVIKENEMSWVVRRMIVLSLVLAIVGSGGGWASAQQPTPPAQPPSANPPAAEPGAAGEDITSDIELTRASIQLRRQALVTAAMDLAPKEAEAFWPLYREYRMEMAKVGDRLSKLLVQYAGQYDTLTDAQAVKIMDEYLSIEKAKNSVKGKFVSRFRKTLPARKVMRFFQIDNKLDAVINAELASIVPLAR
jgi:hypothetical protein